MKARKEQSHCWHTLPVSSNQHFITDISLAWCFIATSICSDVNYIYIFHVALKSLSKSNYPFGPHNIPEQWVSQYIYYLLLHAAKDFINFHHIPPQLFLSWPEEASPVEPLLLWKPFVPPFALLCSFLSSAIFIYSCKDQNCSIQKTPALQRSSTLISTF